MQQIRQPAVAGSFYPDQQQTLANNVNHLLTASSLEYARVTQSEIQSAPKAILCAPKAIIVPHAGYIYSGSVAAAAYARLTAVRNTIKRVLLLGPVHRVPVRGLALPGASIFATPLGDIQIDQTAVNAIINLPQVVVSSAAHAQEHSLEVQLPFLQTVLDDFKLLPLAVGDTTLIDVVEVLNILWGGSETLIVISSDLSHFLPYQTAQKTDTETVQNILRLQATLNHEQACGATPVNGLLLAAKQHQLQPYLLALCNSGDTTGDTTGNTAGDKNRVVGYASIAFIEEENENH